MVSGPHYLCDASFLAAVPGPGDLIERLATALQSPHWPIYLGRRCCPPSVPVLAGVGDHECLEAGPGAGGRAPRAGSAGVRPGRGRDAQARSWFRGAGAPTARASPAMSCWRRQGPPSPPLPRLPGRPCHDYLSRLILNPRSRRVQAEAARPYEMHRSLMHAFPDGLAPDQERVLWRLEVEERGGELTLLVQSWGPPDWAWAREAPGYLVEMQDPNPAVKPVDLRPRLAAGQTLAFRLLANPTKKMQYEKNAAEQGREG